MMYFSKVKTFQILILVMKKKCDDTVDSPIIQKHFFQYEI